VLVALTGIWILVLIKRSDDVRTAVVARATQPSDFPTPKVAHVAGLSRPVAVTAIAKAAPRARVSTRTRRSRAKDVRARPAESKPPEPAPDSGAATLGDSRVGADAPPVPPEPLSISDMQVVALSPSSARITWRTNVPTPTQAAFGLDAPTIWTEPPGQSLIEHERVLSGLDFSTTYRVYLHAVDEWNRAQTASLTLTTGPMPSETLARTSGDRILVDDQPLFPRAVWGQCSDAFGSNIDDGINLFMGDACDEDRQLPARLGGRAFSIVDAGSSNADGRGVIGWYYRDEWDAFLESTIEPADLQASIPAPRPGRISFLTLTNHFYSRAEPLPQGKGMYPVLLSIADVVGFDLYPLQVWCRPAFGDVFDAQRELHNLSGGKPTFQWIEVAQMEQPCKAQAVLDPTPATVRAETWLAIAGGADAIGYFPNHWARPIGDEIARTNRQIKALTPALLAPVVTAGSDTDAVRVSAHALNGALYVIVVNTTETTAQAKISVDGIAGRSLTVLGDGAVVGADAAGFSDTLSPLAARVYIVPPQGW
jgi:hypothetical protein